MLVKLHSYLQQLGTFKQDAEVAVARTAALQVLEASAQPYKAKCVELECLVQAKDAHIAHLEVEPCLAGFFTRD